MSSRQDIRRRMFLDEIERDYYGLEVYFVDAKPEDNEHLMSCFVLSVYDIKNGIDGRLSILSELNSQYDNVLYYKAGYELSFMEYRNEKYKKDLFLKMCDRFDVYDVLVNFQDIFDSNKRTECDNVIIIFKNNSDAYGSSEIMSTIDAGYCSCDYSINPTVNCTVLIENNFDYQNYNRLEFYSIYRVGD